MSTIRVNGIDTAIPAGAVVRAELAKLALVGIDLEDSGDDSSLSEAIPVPLAQKLTSRLQSLGLEASWAPDNDDRELAWVYIRVDL
jgi:hypothetical protein